MNTLTVTIRMLTKTTRHKNEHYTYTTVGDHDDERKGRREPFTAAVSRRLQQEGNDDA